MNARNLSSTLAGVGAALLAAVTVLLVLLAVLPGREPFLADTLSTDAYGPHGSIVFAVLLLFGLATGVLGISLGLRLTGTGGVVCGGLIEVWAVAAVFDAFVRTSRRHATGTAFGQVHTVLAVCGIVAQLVVALVFVVIARRRIGCVPAALSVVTALVLAGVVFVAVHPDSLAGLCERVLFAASGLWLLTSVRVLGQSPRSASGVSEAMVG